MTWEDWHAARQLVSEEFVGGPRRTRAYQEQAAEDAAVEATKDAIRRTQGG